MELPSTGQASDVIFFLQKLGIFAREKWGLLFWFFVGMVFFLQVFLGGFEVLILKMKDVRIVYVLVKFSVVLDVRNEDVHLLVGSNDKGLELCYCGFCVWLCIHHRR